MRRSNASRPLLIHIRRSSDETAASMIGAAQCREEAAAAIESGAVS
jgi:hypothetical protein